MHLSFRSQIPDNHRPSRVWSVSLLQRYLSLSLPFFCPLLLKQGAIPFAWLQHITSIFHSSPRFVLTLISGAKNLPGFPERNGNCYVKVNYVILLLTLCPACFSHSLSPVPQVHYQSFMAQELLRKSILPSIMLLSPYSVFSYQTYEGRIGRPVGSRLLPGTRSTRRPAGISSSFLFFCT